VSITINIKIDSTDQWFSSLEFQLFYDDFGNDTLQINKANSSIDSNYSSITKRSTQYDHFGNLILTTDYRWDKEDSTWVYDSKSVYSFDTTVFKADLAVPDYFNNFTFANQLIQEMDLNYEIDVWQNDQRSTMYYSSLVPTDINEISTGQSAMIFPNPASDFIKINLGSESGNFELFDLQGRHVLSQELTDKTPVSIENLNNGVYFYRINSSDGLFIGKLIIKK
jgi:hypothetical protein